MTHRIAVVLAALVLSLTVGALVGVVIHTSLQQQDSNRNRPSSSAPPAPTSSSGPAISSSVDGEPSTGQGSATDPSSAELDLVSSATAPPSTDPSPTTAPPPVTSGSAPSTTASSSTPATSAVSSSTGTSTATSSSRPGVVYTTVGGRTRTSSSTPSTAGGSSSGSAGTPSSPTSPSSPATTPAGGNVPGGTCSPLGARSATSSGATLFCQSNQSGPGLAWRPVVQGGGCLNQTMTGTGLDGHQYVCRRGAGGLNHWARVS